MTKTQAELALEAFPDLDNCTRKDADEYLMAHGETIRQALAPTAPQKDETGMPEEIMIYIGGVSGHPQILRGGENVGIATKYIRADLVEKDRK